MSWQFDYTKLLVENINKIVPAVLLLITGLTSAFGYVVSANWNNEEEKNKAIHEVTVGFQTVMMEVEVTPAVIKKDNCDWCKEEIIKLKRWHK